MILQSCPFCDHQFSKGIFRMIDTISTQYCRCNATITMKNNSITYAYRIIKPFQITIDIKQQRICLDPRSISNYVNVFPENEGKPFIVKIINFNDINDLQKIIKIYQLFS